MLEEAVRTLKPTSPEEVRDAVAEAGAKARHIEVTGGGTKRSIGSMDHPDVVLSTQRLDRIVDYAPEELVLTVQPGVRLADLEKLVAGKSQMLAFEPPRWTRAAECARRAHDRRGAGRQPVGPAPDPSRGGSGSLPGLRGGVRAGRGVQGRR